MENSTKALLIAASILIVIVLIGVSIKISGSASGVTNQVDTVTDSMEKSVFNSQFSSFFATSTSGTMAKSLVSKAISSNSSSDRQVLLNLYPKTAKKITHKKKASDLQQIFEKISDKSTYKISLTTGCGTYSGGYDNGFIACISITEL